MAITAHIVHDGDDVILLHLRRHPRHADEINLSRTHSPALCHSIFPPPRHHGYDADISVKREIRYYRACKEWTRHSQWSPNMPWPLAVLTLGFFNAVMLVYDATFQIADPAIGSICLIPESQGGAASRCRGHQRHALARLDRAIQP
jgi:hypothetical protein